MYSPPPCLERGAIPVKVLRLRGLRHRLRLNKAFLMLFRVLRSPWLFLWTPSWDLLLYIYSTVILFVAWFALPNYQRTYVRLEVCCRPKEGSHVLQMVLITTDTYDQTVDLLLMLIFIQSTIGGPIFSVSGGGTVVWFTGLVQLPFLHTHTDIYIYPYIFRCMFDVRLE